MMQNDFELFIKNILVHYKTADYQTLAYWVPMIVVFLMYDE